MNTLLSLAGAHLLLRGGVVDCSGNAQILGTHFRLFHGNLIVFLVNNYLNCVKNCCCRGKVR